ncbi:MAG: phosphatase PAP2 family protein [Burkholderiales bacterium]|nr:phosphatase PAP2 family protein [Burkholderiales bacterium]
MRFDWLGVQSRHDEWSRWRRIGGVLLAGALSQAAGAASVPWMPSPAARNAISLLVDDGGLPLTVTQWPLPRDAVQRALDVLPTDLPPSLDAARALVRAELRSQQQARIGLTVRGREDALTGFGDAATPGSSLSLRSSELDGPHLAFQLGGRLDAVADSGARQATARLDDTAVAVDAFGVQAQAWAHRSWWGPGWQSALPLSSNPPPLDGIGLQRAAATASESPWLSWLGPWNMEFFLARTVGEPTGPGSNPLITGLRLTARPFSHLEIGITRMAQFGGSGHAETLGSFARAVAGSHANAQTVEEQSRDSGNGLGGVDARVRCPDIMRCAFYAQIMGEDDRKHLPYKYLSLFGAEMWTRDGSMRFYVEASELGCRVTWRGPSPAGCAYRNYAYPGGYTSGNRWMGASAGPDARFVALGWFDADLDASVRLDYGRIGSRIGTFGEPNGPFSATGRLAAVSVRRSWHFGSASLTPEFDWNRVSTPNGVRVESRAGVEMNLLLDDLGPIAPSRLANALSGTNSSTTTRLLWSAAAIGGAALFDRAASSYADEHKSEPSLKVVRQVGSALPYVGLGLAGAAWLAPEDPRERSVATASVEAGVSAVVLAEVSKLAINRSRPSDGRGAADFGHDRATHSSFPSVHTALAWAVVTPFAQRYDAPWLYGVAALTNAARVSERKHWLSDTVAGSVLGYVVGDWFAGRVDGATGTSVVLVPHGVVVSTTFR